MKKEKILIFNISTDSEDMALGFAINWINKFSEYYDEIDVVTLNKGNTQLLNENINVYSHEFDNFNKIQKFVVLRKIVKKLISCLLYTSPSPRDATLSRMPSSA